MSAHDRNRRGYANPTSHQDLVVKVRGSVVGTGKGALDPDGTDRVTLQGLADCIGPVSDILEVDLALRNRCFSSIKQILRLETRLTRKPMPPGRIR